MVRVANPKVSIVIVNWNKREDVLKLLASLKTIEYDNYEIIVVDNASTDGSVEVIRKNFPEVALIVNKENLGGTGGFNTGIKYALENTDCKYIWLLDNDAEVERKTLIELVKAMETNPEIGIAGSRIMSPDRRNLLVEAGGFIHWHSVTWTPHLRYINENDYRGTNIIETDYVAACSALIRVDALKKTGFMDGRFFLHWDDIDLCLRFKENGYRVVSVFSSRVFHGVEKGFNPLILYYDFRNGLLIMSKRLNGIKRLIFMFFLLKLNMESMVFFVLEKKFYKARLLIYSIRDFLFNRFYKLEHGPVKTGQEKQENINSSQLKHFKKVLIFPEGTYDEIHRVIEKVRKISENAHITLIIQKDRSPLFDKMQVDRIVTFDIFRDSNFKKATLFLKLLFSMHEIGISTSNKYNSPFVYCVKKHLVFNSETDEFVLSKNGIFNLWKVVASVILGDIIALILLPIIYLFSFRYKDEI